MRYMTSFPSTYITSQRVSKWWCSWFSLSWTEATQCSWTTDWYSSPRLCIYLLTHRKLAYGTIHVDRGIPQTLRYSTPAPVSSSVALCGDTNIIATKFVSTKIIYLLSTAHGHNRQNIPNHTRNGVLKKPEVAINYNLNMRVGGVDKQDQLTEPTTAPERAWNGRKNYFSIV